MARFFPSGKPKPGHTVFDVIDDDETAGHLWIGPDTSDDPGAWWIWDMVIDADKRGRGLGRTAMLLGEEHARTQGAHTLGLSVFGFNTGARSLRVARLRDDLGEDAQEARLSYTGSHAGQEKPGRRLPFGPASYCESD